MLSGFSIGSSQPLSCTRISPNHPSACCNETFVTSYLLSCCERGETAGPFPTPPFPCMQVSGLGTVPKSNGKLRMIHDLSSPHGESVNDTIPKDEFSLHYDTIDTAIAYIMQLGRGALLTKIDIRNAFRLCPVSPTDWCYLGISWQGQFYYDKVLPFGLRSAPYIFDKFATALHWILEDSCRLQHLIHYLDDFLHISPPSVTLARRHRSLILDLFSYLGVPVATEKVEGPSTCLTFLGLELDTETFEIRLPEAKRSSYLATVSSLLAAGSLTRRELASAMGKLSFASRAIPAGRTFLRRLYDLDRATSHLPPSKVLRLSQGAINDLMWWEATLLAWPGKSYFLLEKWQTAADLQLQTDASGSFGYGAFYQGRWISGPWQPSEATESIQFKELYAIVVACSTWGSSWRGLKIEFQCDNAAMVECVRSGTCKAPRIMVLVRALYSLCVQYDFLVTATHIPGITNNIADALSRNLLQEFRQLAPAANAEPDKPILPVLD